MQFEEITYREDGPIGTITLNRPDDGNMFTPRMCHEIRDCINEIRRETRTRVIVITGAGDKFFCIGGRKEGMEDTLLYAGVLPTLEMYESIDRLQKPVIASVNGFAVGGGNVLQMVCDITIAKESAVFRQVGPDDGQLRRRLRHLVPGGPGREEARQGDVVSQPEAHRARGARLGAHQPGGAGRRAAGRDAQVCARSRRARRVRACLDQGGLQCAPRRRVGALARMAHDLLLRGYLETEEHEELAKAFAERRSPDASRFGR